MSQFLLWRYINYALELQRLRQRQERGGSKGSRAFRLQDLETRLMPVLQNALTNSD